MGELWIPCNENGFSDEEFVAFGTRRKAEELSMRLWNDRMTNGIQDVRIGRRVARSAVTKNELAGM